MATVSSTYYKTYIMSQNKIIIYQTQDGKTTIDVKLEQDTVWLTQAQMAELSLDGILITYIKKVNCPEIPHVQNLHMWVWMPTKLTKQRYTT